MLDALFLRQKKKNSSKVLLKNLSIACDNQARGGDMIQLLSSKFLCPSTTAAAAFSVLKHLDLCFVHFDSLSCTWFVQGLQANPQLQSLTLSYCTFDKDATDVWASFMQSNNNNRDGSSRRCNWLRKLRLCRPEGPIFDVPYATGTVVASHFAVPPPTNRNNVHTTLWSLSLLRELDLEIDDLGDCLQQLLATQQQIFLRLTHLNIRTKNGTSSVLFQILPTTLYLTHLHLSTTDTYDPPKFTQAILQNGSLQSFRYGELLLCEKAQVYIQRNRFIAALVFIRPDMHDNSDGNLDGSMSKAIINESSCGGNPLVDPSLFPTLAFAMPPANRMAPNFYFKSLLALSEFIGR